VTNPTINTGIRVCGCSVTGKRRSTGTSFIGTISCRFRLLREKSGVVVVVVVDAVVVVVLVVAVVFCNKGVPGGTIESVERCGKSLWNVIFRHHPL